MADADTGLVWRRSTRCGSGACVEVAVAADGVHLRDGKDPDGPRLTFRPDAWRAFVADVQAGAHRTPR